MKIGYVYIITNTSNSVLYTGVTNNINRRIFEHQTKTNVCFSSKYNLKKLIFVEKYEDIFDAIIREKQIKSRNRDRKKQLISEYNPGWKEINIWG